MQYHMHALIGYDDDCLRIDHCFWYSLNHLNFNKSATLFKGHRSEEKQCYYERKIWWNICLEVKRPSATTMENAEEHLAAEVEKNTQVIILYCVLDLGQLNSPSIKNWATFLEQFKYLKI